MKFKPLKGNVLIKQKIEDDKTASGIILSQEKKRHPMGEVVACNTEEPIKVGDMVFFEKLKYVDIELDGEEYVLTKDGHVLGVVNG